MPIRAQVHGSKELSRQLARLGEAVAAQNMVRALTAGALLIQNEAKRRAPYRTGNLRRSIHIGGAADLNPDGGNVTDRGSVPVPDPRVEGNAVHVYVGTDVEYAPEVELGTSNRAASPYLRPAADSQAAAVQQEIAAALRDLIKAAAQ